MGKQAMVVKRGEAQKLRVLGTELAFICGAESTGSAWSLMEVAVPKDSGPPLHEHPWDEAYYIVEGALRFQVGDRTVDARVGDFLFAPGGMPHSFKGISEQPARILAFDAPAAAEAFFREVDREVKRMPADLAKLPEIGRRHRLEFVKA